MTVGAPSRRPRVGVESNRQAGLVEATTLSDCVDRAALVHPDSDALVFPGESVTYRGLADRIDQLARGLVALGVRRSEKVGILMPQSVDNLALFLAAAKIGAVAVPVNARFKPQELRHIVANSDMAVLVTHAALDAAAILGNAFPALPGLTGPELTVPGAPRLRTIVVYGGTPFPAAMPADVFEAGGMAVDDDEMLERRHGCRIRDVAAIMYTSGTTDAPKGAMLTHEALVREGMMVARTRFRLRPEDRVWSVLPFFHIGGIVFAFACFAACSAYCHTGDFRPDTALQQIAAEKCTVLLAGFETIWIPVLNLPGFADADLSAVRIVFCLGVPERMREMQDRLPDAPLVSTWGSTETCSFFSLSDPADPPEARLTTSGTLLPGLEVRVVGIETGQDLGPGEVGELLCRGWSIFEGYYKEDTLTAATLDADQWFHSGDLGYVDESGRVTFSSRLKDMMKVGGENVAAAEIEGLLLTHPAVLSAQVVSAPDAHYTEVAAAFLQLKPGGHCTEQEIIDYCLGKIASFKIPRYVRFTDEWPMSGTKIQKYVLRARIADDLKAKGITDAPRLRSR